MESKGYNGWSNYETWNVKLWIDNEQGSYEYWCEQTRDALTRTDNTADRSDRINDVCNDISEQLKREHEDNAPEVVGTYADLLNAALSEVNWYEIAEAMVNDELENDSTLLEAETEETDKM